MLKKELLKKIEELTDQLSETVGFTQEQDDHIKQIEEDLRNSRRDVQSLEMRLSRNKEEAHKLAEDIMTLKGAMRVMGTDHRVRRGVTETLQKFNKTLIGE